MFMAKSRQIQTLSPKRLQDIVFTNPEQTREVSVKPYPNVFEAGPCKDPDVFFAEILKGLKTANPKCVLFKTLNNESTDISHILQKFETPYMFTDDMDLLSNVCYADFVSFVNDLHLSKEDIDLVNAATKGQSRNTNWSELRKVTLTASNFGNICKRRESTPPDNLIKQLRYNSPVVSNSLRYGRKNENKARRVYAKEHLAKCGSGVVIDDMGLVLSEEFPFLGASVDGIVNCRKCGKGIVEVKCPYKWRNKHPLDCAKDKDFYCELKENNIVLKDNHNYMYQIMGQMAVLQLEWVDFVVWTKKGASTQRILFDRTFWEEKMLFKLKNIFTTFFVAELFSCRVRRGKQLVKCSTE